GGSSGQDRQPRVRMSSLMSALQPLVVRDSQVLVRAASNVLSMVSEDTGGAGAAGRATVTLVPHVRPGALSSNPSSSHERDRGGVERAG
ncbi:unnamed protein product, partial [Discosporangium mesarthrocarpum]